MPRKKYIQNLIIGAHSHFNNLKPYYGEKITTSFITREIKKFDNSISFCEIIEAYKV